MKKPNKQDIASFYHNYFDLVPDDNLLENLKEINNKTINMLQEIPKGKEEYRYQPDKWNIKQIVCHLTAAELYFRDLVVRITKEKIPPPPSYNYDKYDMGANENKSFAELIQDFQETRKATIQFYRDFDPDLLNDVYTINGNKYSPVGVGYVIMGHEVHHVNILREKYLAE